MLERAYRDRHVRHLHIDRPHSKLGVRQDALEALDHIQVAEPCSDQRSLTATQQRGDGTLRAKQRFPQLDMSSEFSHNVSKHVEVLRRRVGHDVAVLGPSHHTPRSQRQSADDDKADLRPNEATEKLIEERSTQRARRAASRNSNSLRASKIVSSRFTASGRCPSARSRSLRTRSPCKSSECCVDRSAITPNSTDDWSSNGSRRAVCRKPAGCDYGGRGWRESSRNLRGP
jgi:hypothetical protein